jgi:hypothetical protein
MCDFELCYVHMLVATIYTISLFTNPITTIFLTEWNFQNANRHTHVDSLQLQAQ